MKNTIDRIHKDLETDISGLLNHPFIQNLADGLYSKEQIKVFGEQYYILSCAFTEFLILASSSIKEEKFRVPIIDNIYDEHGRGNYLHSHRILLIKFLKAINAKGVDEINPLPHTSANIYGMKKLCETGTLNEIIGAIGPGCEYFTDTQYEKIVNSLYTNYNYSKDDLHFFYEHISHDPRHTEDIDSIITEIIKTESDYDELLFGAKQAIIFETLFWDGLFKTVGKPAGNTVYN